MSKVAVRPIFAVQGRPVLQRTVRALVAAVIVLNTIYALSLWAVARPESGYLTWWDGWLFHVAITLPAPVAALRAVSDRRLRGAWWAVTIGILCNTAGSLLFTYYDQNLDPIPFPAPSDAPYLASYLAFAVGLTLATQGGAERVSKAVRLDGLVVGLAVASVAVAIWFDEILEQSGSAAAVVVGLAYPLMNVVIIVIAVAGLSATRYRPTPAAAAFIAAAAIMGFGDVVYLRQISADTYVPGTALEATWIVGIVLFGLAPWFGSDRRAASSSSTVSSLIPALAATSALGVVALSVRRDVPEWGVWLAIASIGAVLARVGLTVRELRRANEAFGQARTDELTGLLNRRGFSEELDVRLARGEPLWTLMIDLNGFKEVNDSLGHHAGDRLLVAVARRFVAASPSQVVVARLGGDEFGVAFAKGNPVDVAEALTECLRDPIALDGIAVRVGASIGIAESPEHGNTRDELLRAADVAMYDAKANHLGIARYSADHDPNSRDRLALSEELRVAIDERSFEMHYQPTVDVTTGRVVGMEALIRWNHPTRGMMAPDAFVPLAERIGLIPAMTRAVLDLSIEHLAAVQGLGYDLGLSVNISAKDLVDETLPAYVRATLAAYEVAGTKLTLEITETAIMSDSTRAERVLNELRADGVRISIDDFGVGYSSMSQLLELPLDELKLDRSFIANLAQDVRAQAVLSATVELGRTLGLDVVAEGVEHVDAYEAVTRRGVEIAQGYYFSPALAPVAFAEFLAHVESTAEPVSGT